MASNDDQNSSEVLNLILSEDVKYHLERIIDSKLQAKMNDLTQSLKFQIDLKIKELQNQYE